MRSLRIAFALAALALAAAPAVAQETPKPPMKVGVNVGGGITYYDGRVFADLMRQGSQLGNDGGWPRKPITPRRPDGYHESVGPDTGKPNSILASVGEPWPAGEYRITAEGKGRINLGNSAKNWTAQAYFDLPGGESTHVFTATTPKPIRTQVSLGFQVSDAADPVRNVRIVAPDADPSSIFTAPAVADLKGFATLRFMDARYVNNSKHVTWADYEASMASFTNDGRGWPLEDCAALANRTGGDPWFCIPHKADDDYVRKMAETIDKALDPDRTIYIEYSNEVWNGIFHQYHWSREEYLKLKNPGMSLFTYQGVLAARKINLFRASLPPERKVVRVVSAQAGWYGAARETFVGASKEGGFDAIACAPYFDGSIKTAADAAALAASYNAADEAGKKALIGDLIVGCHESIRTRRDLFKEWAKIAKTYGVPLLAYEGGQHMTPGGNPALEPLYTAANKDPRMGSAYSRYLADAEAEGFSTFVLYSSLAQYHKNSSWGLKEYAGQPPTPKSAAVEPYKGR